MSNYSQVICVCSKEAKSVHFKIVPKKLGQLPLAVAAKDIVSSACGNTSEQIHLGVSDAVIRNLLVEVSLSSAHNIKTSFVWFLF